MTYLLLTQLHVEEMMKTKAEIKLIQRQLDRMFTPVPWAPGCSVIAYPREPSAEEGALEVCVGFCDLPDCEELVYAYLFDNDGTAMRESSSRGVERDFSTWDAAVSDIYRTALKLLKQRAAWHERQIKKLEKLRGK